ELLRSSPWVRVRARAGGLADAPLAVRPRALAAGQRGSLPIPHDGLVVAEIVDPDVLELEAQLFGDHLPRRDGRDVREQLLAPVAEARGLDRAHLQRATQLVDHQRR